MGFQLHSRNCNGTQFTQQNEVAQTDTLDAFSPINHFAVPDNSKSPCGMRDRLMQLRTKCTGDERGGSLVLALVFLIVTSLVVLSLANLAQNDLNNTMKFRSAHSMQSVANSATEVALHHVRYNFMSQTLNASPPEPCFTTSPTPSTLTLNGASANAWCSTQWAPLSSKTRVVTIDTCSSATSAAQCGQNPLLQAIVTFDDYPSPMGAVSTAQCTTKCGISMTINSWAFDSLPPTVQSISPTTGTTAGGTPITITGTGYVSGATVNFVSTNLASNVVLAATSTVVVDQTTITAVTPPMASGLSYYVTVTTPVGTSPYGPTFN